MISAIVSKFQNFRDRLFRLFPYRAGATLDLIDTVSAETNMTSIVKLSLSGLFRRQYSSLTDVLGSLFRTNLNIAPANEEIKEQTLKVTRLLAEECAPAPKEKSFVLFAVDCTAAPRIHAKKVCDRTVVHAPNHVPGQKPITVGHEYSVLVYLPNGPTEKDLHWVVPLSVKRVGSHESGPQAGFVQLKEIACETVFGKHFCVSVADAAYATRGWIIGADTLPNVVHIARMRSNRIVYRMPLPGGETKRGRPLIYGEEIFLADPPQPDLEESTTFTTRKGQVHHVLLERWNDVIVKGSRDERVHEHPFDILRVTVTDKKGKPVYRRPLWVMITGEKRREVTSREAYTSYGRRYDIEHLFRFGKQRLGLANSQTCETRHEESWHWIGLLAYNMLYHARQFSQAVLHSWEKRKVQVAKAEQRPSQVQRDYERIIRGIGTPAPVPKPRGKSPGRRLGEKSGQRPDQPLIRKSNREEPESPDEKLPVNKNQIVSRRRSPIKDNGSSPSGRKVPALRYRCMRRIWVKNRPPPMRC